MISERETLQRIGVWMEEGRTALPDHVIDAVLDQLPTKPQRRPWWPARRISGMSPLAKFAIAVAAVVVVAFAAFDLLRPPDRPTTGVTPPSTTRPEASRNATPSFEPSRYRWTAPGGSVSFAVPYGWRASPDGVGNDGGDTEIAMSPHLPGSRYEVTHVFSDACETDGTQPNDRLTPIGPSVSDLVRALDDQVGTDATIASIPGGTRIVLRQAAGLDRTSCSEGAGGPLKIWADSGITGYYALGVGHTGEVYVFEVGGERFVFAVSLAPGATDGDRGRLQDIVDSLEITTATPSGSPSLPALGLPGTRGGPAGVYGWESGPGERGGLHWIKDGDETSLIFEVGAGCLAGNGGQRRAPVRVAGLDGVSLPVFTPPVAFNSEKPDAITRAYALAVGYRTLCVFLTWYPTTSEARIQAAEAALQTLRAEPIGDDRIRITFTLDEGWDTG